MILITKPFIDLESSIDFHLETGDPPLDIVYAEKAVFHLPTVRSTYHFSAANSLYEVVGKSVFQGPYP